MLYCFLGGLATTTYVSINEESISRLLYHIYTIELSYWVADLTILYSETPICLLFHQHMRIQIKWDSTTHSL